MFSEMDTHVIQTPKAQTDLGVERDQEIGDGDAGLGGLLNGLAGGVV